MPVSNRFLVGLACACAIAASCAAPPGPVGPHDVSVAKHEELAHGEDRSARVEQAQYDPSARAERPRRCDMEPIGPEDATVCWGSTANPSAAHLQAAQEHRVRAAQHRAESEKLRNAEASACERVPAADRDMSPFRHPEDILSVAPLTEATPKGARVVGAAILFRAVPKMTEAWLQRVIDCHLARNDALGHDVPEMPYCPLVPMGAVAQVTATSRGFAVAIRSSDAAAAAEILRRARLLVDAK